MAIQTSKQMLESLAKFSPTTTGDGSIVGRTTLASHGSGSTVTPDAGTFAISGASTTAGAGSATASAASTTPGTGFISAPTICPSATSSDSSSSLDPGSLHELAVEPWSSSSISTSSSSSPSRSPPAPPPPSSSSSSSSSTCISASGVEKGSRQALH
ncbi:unnamed protein product [Sympodiomycopsis kandeliae]